MLINFISCQRDISSCNCNRIDIYGILHDITFIVRISEDDIRRGGISGQITDQKQIDRVKKLILNLDLLSKDYDGIDVKVVLDLICKNGGKSTILLNEYILQIGNEFYEPNDSLIKLIEQQLKI